MMSDLHVMDENMLIFQFAYLHPAELAKMAVTCKQFESISKVASKVLLQQLSAQYLSSRLINPSKCMKMGHAMVRKFLKLAWSYVQATGRVRRGCS
jgi:hypothetical protein